MGLTLTNGQWALLPDSSPGFTWRQITDLSTLTFSDPNSLVLNYSVLDGLHSLTMATLAASNIAPFYYAHQDRNPELHKKLESWFFQNNYGKNPMALKYTGEVSLPVTKILVYNGQNWIES
jgi:hypothetical protein